MPAREPKDVLLTMPPTSFWLADALHGIGRTDEATELSDDERAACDQLSFFYKHAHYAYLMGGTRRSLSPGVAPPHRPMDTVRAATDNASPPSANPLRIPGFGGVPDRQPPL